MKSDAHIFRTLSHSDVKESPSKFGPVPTGSVLSYQQKPLTNTGDIINLNVQYDFPEPFLPEQHSHYNRVLSFAEHNLYLGMHIDRTQALELEEQIRSQSANKLWHEIRRHMITSTMFICVRKADLEKLAVRPLKSKNIQTAPMKFRLENEPVGATLYSKMTGNHVYVNNVYLCCFVINPSIPYLGGSPDFSSQFYTTVRTSRDEMSRQRLFPGMSFSQ